MSPMLRGDGEKREESRVWRKGEGKVFGKGVEDREFIAVENIRLVCLLKLTAESKQMRS